MRAYSYDTIIRPGLIIFKLFENDFSTVLIIESFRKFSQTVLIIETVLIIILDPEVSLIQ